MKIKINKNHLDLNEQNSDKELKKKRSINNNLLKDFESTRRGKLQISLEFLSNYDYQMLSKYASADDINNYFRYVRSLEKTIPAKKKAIIGAMLGVDAITALFGIKWYKDITLGFLAGWQQASAEEALHSFYDADMGLVLGDLYNTFKNKQPQSKKQMKKIIEDEDPSLLLPVTYKSNVPGIWQVLSDYPSAFDVKEGSWSDPLAESFGSAINAIDKILEIYSHPPLSKYPRGHKGGLKISLEGFVQFLEDVLIYRNGNLDDDKKLKRTRKEIFKAIQYAKSLSKSVIDIGNYLKKIDKYKSNPKMIMGAYLSYKKTDPFGIVSRIEIILPFLTEILKRRLDYPEQDAAANRMRRINNKYFKPLQTMLASQEFDKSMENFESSLKEAGMKKIKLTLSDITVSKIEENLINEGRWSDLFNIFKLSRPASLNFHELGSVLKNYGNLSIAFSKNAKPKLTNMKNLKNLLNHVNDIILNIHPNESLESLTKIAMSNAATKGEAQIVKISYKDLAKTGEVVDSAGLTSKEIFVLVDEGGIVSFSRSSGDLVKQAAELKRLKTQPEHTRAAGGEKASLNPAAPTTRGLSRIEADLAEMLRISQKGEEFYMGSIKNPFPDAKTYEYYIKGGVFKISEKLPGFLGGGKTLPTYFSKQYKQYLADPSRRESNTFSELNMWHAIQPTGREGDFVYVGTRSADGATTITSALGYQNGILTPTSNIKQVKTTKKTAAGDEQTLGQESIPADAFKENPMGMASNLRSQTNKATLGVDMSGEIFTAFQGIKNIGVPARTWKVMREVYFTPNTKHPRVRGLLNFLDLAGTSFGTRIGEPFFIALLKESGYLRTQTIISFARAWRFFKAAATAAYVVLQVLALGREFYGKMSDEARGVERKKEAFLADPGNSNLRLDYEKAARGHAKAIAKWLKDNGYPGASANLTDKVEELSKISDPSEQIEQLEYITDMAVTYLGTSEDENAQLAEVIENNGFVKSLKDPYEMTLGQIDAGINDILNKSVVELGVARAKKGVRGLDPDSLPTPDELRQKRDEAIKYIKEKAKELARQAAEEEKQREERRKEQEKTTMQGSTGVGGRGDTADQEAEDEAYEKDFGYTTRATSEKESVNRMDNLLESIIVKNISIAKNLKE